MEEGVYRKISSWRKIKRRRKHYNIGRRKGIRRGEDQAKEKEYEEEQQGGRE